jgi:FAD/FMN-containing dehydrogenase
MSLAALDELHALLGAAGLLTDADAMAPFLTDWRGRFRGAALAVAMPANTEQVAAVITGCARRGVSVVPQGGHTGLCGGATPRADSRSLVLSLRRMNRVREVDLDNATLTCDAGCVLADIQAAAEAHGRLFPLSLAAEGSAQIGGVLSTNAGGTAVLRYGNARDLVLGLEVVLPDGRVWHGLRGLRKDNTGYDLKQLFVGAEGTLGIITGAVLKLMPRPQNVVTALVALPHPAAAVQLLRELRDQMADRLGAFELFDRGCLELVMQHLHATRDPFLAPQPWYGLIELADTWTAAPLQQRLEELLGDAFECGIALDAAFATSGAQRQALWALRENISEAQLHAGYALKYDIALPLSAIAAFLEETVSTLRQQVPGIRIAPFGHVGDGNLHFNLREPEGASHETLITGLVYGAVRRHHGSFSAEHGIGQLKVATLAQHKQGVELDLFGALKRAIDPMGLMNPGKIIAPASDTPPARVPG